MDVDSYRIPPKSSVWLPDLPTRFTWDDDDERQAAKLRLQLVTEEIATLQDSLNAEDKQGLLVIFQAMDAGGKDGTIRHVFSGVNPAGFQVFDFKQPTQEELDHDYMWRAFTRLPEQGRIGIFNRSYYEEIGVVRVHPAILKRQKLPKGAIHAGIWKERAKDMRAFERYLHRQGFRVVKFFLHVSKHEQAKRLLRRMKDRRRHWKLSTSDMEERELWAEYMAAYSDIVNWTSTEEAPWYVIPADDKKASRLIVATVVRDALRDMAPKYPEPTEVQLDMVAEFKGVLKAEVEAGPQPPVGRPPVDELGVPRSVATEE